MPNPPDAQAFSGAITTIEGCRFSIHGGDGELVPKGMFTLDASVNPKAITWVDSMGADAGKHLPASYELHGDRFVFIATGEGCPRPTGFHTEPGQVMRTFVRKR